MHLLKPALFSSLKSQADATMLLVNSATVGTTTVEKRVVLSGDLALPLFAGTLLKILSSGKESIPEIEYLNITRDIPVVRQYAAGWRGLSLLRVAIFWGIRSHY